MGPEELCLFSQRTNDDLNWRTKEVFVCFFVLRFYGPVNTVKVMSSWSVNLATLFLGRRPKRLTSIKFPYLRQYLTTVLHVFVSAVWRAWRRNYFLAKSQKEVCMQKCSYKHDNYSKYTYNVHVWLYSITYNFDLYLMVSQSLRAYIPIIWMMKTEGNLNPEGMSQSKIATLFFTKAKVEMSHDTTKPTKWLCAQSDQSSLCAHRYLRIQGLFLFFFMRTAKTLIRLGACPGWSESSLGAHTFCWSCHVAAQYVSLIKSRSKLLHSEIYGPTFRIWF